MISCLIADGGHFGLALQRLPIGTDGLHVNYGVINDYSLHYTQCDCKFEKKNPVGRPIRPLSYNQNSKTVIIFNCELHFMSVS